MFEEYPFIGVWPMNKMDSKEMRNKMFIIFMILNVEALKSGMMVHAYNPSSWCMPVCNPSSWAIKMGQEFMIISGYVVSLRPFWPIWDCL